MHSTLQSVSRVIESILAQCDRRSRKVLSGTQQLFPAMMSASIWVVPATEQAIRSNFCVLRMPDLKIYALHPALCCQMLEISVCE
jgi:hypothetical protein